MRSLLTLALALLLPAPPASAEQTVNGLPFADEYVWRSDYFTEWTGSLDYPRMFRQAVFQTEEATKLLQGVQAAADHGCPVRFAHRRVLPFRVDWPEFETIQSVSFRIAPGVYLYETSNGSRALTPGDTAKVGAGPGLAARGGWTLAHEIGHNAGLFHEPQSLMSGDGPSDEGKTVTAAQCEAFLAGGVLEGKSPCLLYDAGREAQGLWPYVPAPRWTPCSDGAGFCNGVGTCVATRAQCFGPDGGTSIGTDCSAGEFCGVCTGWSGRCVPCETPRNRSQSGVCGNGIPEPGEQCDDGNYYGGDGCTATCKLSALLPAFSSDGDGDGVPDYRDRCPGFAPADPGDLDGDGVGDLCDRCPAEPYFDRDRPCEGEADEDGDGLANFIDNCPGVVSPNRADYDADYVGDACDGCKLVPNTGQVDRNRDGVPDRCQCGDAIPDGYLNFADVGCLAACVLGRAIPPCSCDHALADTQNDGKLGFDDATAVSAAILGEFPASELICAARPTNELP